MDVGRQYRRLIGRNEVRMADPELRLGQLLQAGKLLLPGAQLGQGFRLDAGAGNTAEQSGFGLIDADEHNAKWGGLPNSLRHQSQRLLERHLRVQRVAGG